MSERKMAEEEKRRGEKYWRPRASAGAAIRPPINYIDVKNAERSTNNDEIKIVLMIPT